MKQLEYITFKQFIYTINIRNYYNNSENEECMDNQIIRIRYDRETIKDGYIDIGWFDFGTKNAVWKTLEKTLNKDILNSKIISIFYDKTYDILELGVDLNPNESLEEWGN